MICRKCGSDSSIKNGHHHGRQRYKCKICGFQYTQEHSHGKSPQTKCLAITLYTAGLSLRAIGSIVHVSSTSVLNWVREFGLMTYEKPQPQGDIVVELDEMWHFIHSKKTNSGSGKRFVVLQVNSLTGNVENVMLTP